VLAGKTSSSSRLKTVVWKRCCCSKLSRFCLENGINIACYCVAYTGEVNMITSATTVNTVYGQSAVNSTTNNKADAASLPADALPMPARRLAPVISYVQAGQWVTLVDAYPMGNGSEMIEIDAKWSKNSFVLKVRGDSMAPTLTEGAYIVVDPTVEWMHGRIVVVRQNGDTEVTVKRLQQDGDSYYLKADNPVYGVMKLLPDAHVCGVVVEMMVKFL
jgi:SOS-response transcriptional repressor LexA